jgi:type II secretory pathway pseudopilin PulG
VRVGQNAALLARFFFLAAGTTLALYSAPSPAHSPDAAARGMGEKSQMLQSPSGARGLTVIELVVVVVIIMVVSSFGVPRLRDSIERAYVRDAFIYLSAVVDAQNSFKENHGVYAWSRAELVDLPKPPQGFAIGGFRPGTSGDLVGTWALEVKRRNAPIAYGSYSITFTERGYAPHRGSLTNHESIAPYTKH